MRIFFDAHVHSHFSRATSDKMDLYNLAKYGRLKGLDLLGTGDFTHPRWLNELKNTLEPLEGELYQYERTNFMLTVELSTVYEQEGKTRKIHHLVFAPSFEVVDQLNDQLSKYTDLSVDGRPTFNNLTSPELVELIMNTSKECLVTPAHAYTPWWSLFGSRSGFDRIGDCYQDQTKYIYALETGLSSDPPMSWVNSSLDRFTLVSFSDAHSPWNFRLGREATVFDLDKLSYEEIINSIKKKDRKRIEMTIELNPKEGKYHWDGHRKCGVRMSPEEAKKRNNICPECGRKLTVGVMHRVVSLADRPKDFVPRNAIPYVHLIPLQEIIASVEGIDTLYSKKVWNIFNRLVGKFGNEYDILLKIPGPELEKVVSRKLANAIIRVRNEKVSVVPGYDGVYGTIEIFSEEGASKYKSPQKSLSNFG